MIVADTNLVGYIIVLAEVLDTVLVTGDRKLVRKCPDRAILIDRFAPL